MRTAVRQLRTLVLILSFIVGPLMCACAHAAALPTQTQTKLRACCIEAHARLAAQAPTQTHHEDCPHCAQARLTVLSAEASHSPDLSPMQALAMFNLAMITPTISLAEPAKQSPRVCSEKIPPPPDLLRVKCSLQI